MQVNPIYRISNSSPNNFYFIFNHPHSPPCTFDSQSLVTSCQNITRAQNCSDVTILNSLFVFVFSPFVVFLHSLFTQFFLNASFISRFRFGDCYRISELCELVLKRFLYLVPTDCAAMDNYSALPLVVRPI